MNMRLIQRGHNQCDDAILKQYLDSINHSILDDDLILLNQLATIKSLSTRKAFCLSEAQISRIHKKFFNMYDYRQGQTTMIAPNKKMVGRNYQERSADRVAPQKSKSAYEEF